MARQLAIKKFNDGVAEQEKLQDKLFLKNMPPVAVIMAATHAWRQKITTTRTADVLAMTALPMARGRVRRPQHRHGARHRHPEQRSGGCVRAGHEQHLPPGLRRGQAPASHAGHRDVAGGSTGARALRWFAATRRCVDREGNEGWRRLWSWRSAWACWGTAASAAPAIAAPPAAQAATVTQASGMLNTVLPQRLLDTRTSTGGHHVKARIRCNHEAVGSRRGWRARRRSQR